MSEKVQKNISIIISIVGNTTKVSFIPRDIREDIGDILSIQS